MEQYTEVTFMIACAMDLEYKFGQTTQSTRASGVIIRQMERGSSGMQTVTFMRANGRMIKQMGTASTFT